jgi:two-component system, OmpR family, response regulator PhoP
MPPKRLLVVEDYQQLRDLIGTVLREVGGYSIQAAADSQSTERLIAEHPFDLILLDVGVPGGLSGREIAALARLRLGCPILFMTGRDLAEADWAGLMEPGDRFLHKPFKMDVLLAEVATLLKIDARKTLELPKAKRVRVPNSRQTTRSSQ